MQRHPEYTRTRLAQLATRMRTKIYPITQNIEELLVSPQVDRISWKKAQELAFRPAKVGEQFGPLWATYWFRLKTVVPKEWAGKRVDLLWISHSEATLWIDGRSIQGLNHELAGWDKSTRSDAVLIEKAKGGETIKFQIEMACNRVSGDPGAQYFKPISPYMLEQADIAAFDPAMWELYHDFRTLQELEAEQDIEPRDLDKTWAGELLFELNRFANLFDLEDTKTWPAAKEILSPLLTRRNASRVHELSAIGHAHIDTAWLWPLAETDRKCIRTFSSQTTYMDSYPEYRFACSQAYQYESIKHNNPDLYERIKKKIKAGQWIPVGGTWIEPDCNIPSGEALCRQFLHGQRFFEKEFGIRCKEFWNPDVFGYNGQLPQIISQAGMKRFLTQKLSWNRFNKPNHHTFKWQGIDGSEVLAHFPPVDTYNAIATVGEMRKHARNYKDHDRSRHAMYLFGYGDGGGGPNKTMLETLRRVKDLQGVPRSAMRTSDEFFDLLEKDGVDWPTVVGELYFEYHRGTYTTQAATKKGNRKSEFLLHDIEFLSAVGSAKEYPSSELDALWKIVLLNQFHDILPGSSITLVYEDAAVHYADVARRGGALRDRAAKSLVSGGSSGFTPINTIGFARKEVVDLPDGSQAFAEAGSYGIGQIIPAADSVKLEEKAGRIVLENAHLRAELAADGKLVSLIEKQTGRESLAGPADLKLYEDIPTNFDAWDVDPFHMETESDAPPAKLHSKHATPLRAEVVFDRSLSAKSSMRQTIRLDADSRRLEFHCEVDWHESNRMLKATIPVNVRAMNATYDMQFGSVERPTHFNTPYDLARYEVPGHKWADLSEFGFGVSLLSECKYGFSTFGNVMRMSLLRSPKMPDPVADMGKHAFTYAIYPHPGAWREAGVVGEAYRFNSPMLIVPGKAACKSFASVDDPNLVLDTIKKAEDSDQIVLRLYECHGARGKAKIRVDRPFKSATLCNILEEDQDSIAASDGVIEVEYQPFQIISIKLK